MLIAAPTFMYKQIYEYSLVGKNEDFQLKQKKTGKNGDKKIKYIHGINNKFSFVFLVLTKSRN